MIRYALVLLLAVSATHVKAQQYWPTWDCNVITFDSGACLLPDSLLYIDTINYPHNIWQVGRPRKTVFDTSYSGLNAIVTDTTNPYTSADTSIFYITVPLGNYGYSPYGGTFGEIQFVTLKDVDSDAVTDVDYSIDAGRTWISTTTLSITMSSVTSGGKVWNLLHTSFPYLSGYETDSVRFRFTFIPGTDTVHHDGWIFDNIRFSYWYEGVLDPSTSAFQVFPNPSNGPLYVRYSGHARQRSLEVYNYEGRKIYGQDLHQIDNYLYMNLPGGNYVVRLYEGEQYISRHLTITER